MSRMRATPRHTPAVGVATDFDNTYKLSPQRLVWNIQKLGLVGEIDHYCGVFWWKQAVVSNPSYPQCTVTFSGKLERSGRRVAAHRRLRDRQDCLRRAGQQQHHRSALRQLDRKSVV